MRNVIPNMKMKTCVKCKKKKSLSEFHKNSRSKDGLHSYCKDCNKKAAAKFLKTGKGKVALKRAIRKKRDEGYYRYGKGAIPILRQGAKKRGISFKLTAEELENWWLSTPDICHYCGITIEKYIFLRDFVLSYSGMNYEIRKFKRFFRSSKHSSISWMTIDRLNNKVGYEIDNVVKSCWFCNSLKSDFFTEEQFKCIGPSIIESLENEIRNEMT